MRQAAIFFGTIIALVAASWFFTPTDPTDLDKSNRSGMAWHKDYGTGCEYLSGGGLFGKEVLVPRLDKNGKHICGADNE